MNGPVTCRVCGLSWPSQSHLNGHMNAHRRELTGKRHPSRVDMTGERVGSLTVLKEAPPRKDGNARWLCRCDCGAEVTRLGIGLRAAAKRGYRSGCPSCRPVGRPRKEAS